MSEQQGFLDAIRAEPDDDGHRLVFADWLDESGKPLWAELIRAQCALSRLLVVEEESFRWADAFDVQRLRPELRAELLAPFTPLIEELDDEAELWRAVTLWARRGLVEAVEVRGGLTAREFAQHAPAIFRDVPVRHLRLGVWNRQHSDRFEMIPVRIVKSLLEQEWVAGLETIDLHELTLGEAGARCLYRAQSRLTRLRHLTFNRHDLPEDDVQTLRRVFGEALKLFSYGGMGGDDDIPF